MTMLVDRRVDGWYVDEERLPGVDVEATRAFRSLGYWPDKTLGDMIQESAARFPGRTALVVGDRRVSYSEIDDLSNRLALGFFEHGIGPGDMVAVQLPNGLEHVLTVFALAKVGAVCNIIVPMMRENEVGYILNHCRSKAIVIPHYYGKFDYPKMVEGLSKSVPSLTTVIVTGEVTHLSGLISFDELLKGPKKFHPSNQLAQLRPHPDDVSLVGFTSGTTAQPKAYLHTHNTEYANSYSCMLADSYRDIGKPGVNIALPGFAWMYGRWCNLFSGVLEGAANVIVDPFTPEAVFEAIRKESATHLHGAPAVFRALLDKLLVLQDSGTSPIAAFHYAGSTMSFEMAKQLRSRAQLLTCYGLSEISPVCANSFQDPPDVQIRTSGRPTLGNKVVIMDSEGNSLQAEKEGEICVSGPGLTLGYLRQAEANAAAFVDAGFFKTGDLGFLDKSGNLNITGRSKDVIDRGGVKFSPREVEELLLAHPAIKGAAVVGMPDPKLGERSCAFVVTVEDGKSVELHEVVDFLRGKGLATHKLPERLEIIDTLPTTATGKVQKYILRKRVAEQISQETGIRL